jgi:hypothetical protein
MPVFIAVPLANNITALDVAVNGAFESKNCYKLQNDSGWLISFDGTTNQLTDALGITGQPKGTPTPVGSTLVSLVGAYYGRGPTDMWEWLSLKLSA